MYWDAITEWGEVFFLHLNWGPLCVRYSKKRIVLVMLATYDECLHIISLCIFVIIKLDYIARRCEAVTCTHASVQLQA